MNIRQIENAIFWNEHVAAATKDQAQKARCNDRILRFMQQLMELKQSANEHALDRGAIESRAWHDTSAELN